MLRLALLGLLAFSQVSADCSAGSSANQNVAKGCVSNVFNNPTTDGTLIGSPCLANTSYSLHVDNCEFDAKHRAFQVTFFKCPDPASDGYLLFQTESGTTTIKASDCHAQSASYRDGTPVGYGESLNFTLVQGTKPFAFFLTAKAVSFDPPTTTTVATTRGIPVKPTTTPDSAKLDLVVVVDISYNTEEGLKAVKYIATELIKKTNPVITTDRNNFVRINPVIVGSPSLSVVDWTNSNPTNLQNLISAFPGLPASAGSSSYLNLGSNIKQSFDKANKNFRDHTTRAVLIFTNNDTAATDAWTTVGENGGDYITFAQQYDVHTIIVPVDSDVTNIKAQLATFPDVSTKPIFYNTVDSSNFTAEFVADDLHENFLLNGVKLCNIKCETSGNEFKLPNVPKMFEGNNYCANTQNFHCSLDVLFQNANCDFSELVNITLNEYDIDAGRDSLNFYEVAETASFSALGVKNSEFQANASDGFFLFNTVPSSVYGGFDMTIACKQKPTTPTQAPAPDRTHAASDGSGSTPAASADGSGSTPAASADGSGSTPAASADGSGSTPKA